MEFSAETGEFGTQMFAIMLFVKQLIAQQHMISPMVACKIEADYVPDLGEEILVTAGIFLGKFGGWCGPDC